MCQGKFGSTLTIAIFAVGQTWYAVFWTDCLICIMMNKSQTQSISMHAIQSLQGMWLCKMIYFFFSSVVFPNFLQCVPLQPEGALDYIKKSNFPADDEARLSLSPTCFPKRSTHKQHKRKKKEIVLVFFLWLFVCLLLSLLLLIKSAMVAYSPGMSICETAHMSSQPHDMMTDWRLVRVLLWEAAAGPRRGGVAVYLRRIPPLDNVMMAPVNQSWVTESEPWRGAVIYFHFCRSIWMIHAHVWNTTWTPKFLCECISAACVQSSDVKCKKWIRPTIHTVKSQIFTLQRLLNDYHLFLCSGWNLTARLW